MLEAIIVRALSLSDGCPGESRRRETEDVTTQPTPAGKPSSSQLERELRRARVAAESEARRRQQIESSTSYRIGRMIVQAAKRVTPTKVWEAVRSRGRGVLPRATAPAKRDGAIAPVVAALPPVSGGKYLSHQQALDARTALVVVVGASDDEVARIVHRTAIVQTMMTGFKPLFVTDCVVPDVFRRHTYAFEYVVPHDEWRRHFPDRELWHDYLLRRLDALRLTYEVDNTVFLRDAPDDDALRVALTGCLMGTGDTR